MVTTDKVTVAEFSPHIGKTTTDYKENDMGVKATESRFNQTVQKDQATLIAELISRVTSLEDTVEFILEQLQIHTAENTNDIESKPTATSSTEVPWWIGE